MDNVLTYLIGVLTEGLLIGGLFWVISYMILESTSLFGALRAGLIAELVGNIHYLWGIPAVSPPGMVMTLIGMAVFVRLILSVGELTLGRTLTGVCMTYFALIALVTCS